MALITEDGTGLINSESYISVTDATTYHANFGNDAWVNLDVSQQEIYLRKASRDIDALYGTSYLSSMLTTTQALLWPRNSYTNFYGITVTGIPVQLKNTVAELALLNASVDVLGPTDNAGNLKMDLVKVDTIETRKEYFAPTSSIAPKMRKIALLIQPLLKSGSNGLYAEVVRG